MYEPSSHVDNVIDLLEEQRGSLMQIQVKYGVEVSEDLESYFLLSDFLLKLIIRCCHVLQISCGLDIHLCGMVEAWASGLTWREIMMDCATDEGDLARLLRRTIDLLSQVCILLLMILINFISFVILHTILLYIS